MISPLALALQGTASEQQKYIDRSPSPLAAAPQPDDSEWSCAALLR